MASADITLSDIAPSEFCVREAEITVTCGTEVVVRKILSHGEYVLGSDPVVDVQLALPGIAPRHARLSVTSDGFYLEALDPSVSTFLDDQPLARRTKIDLAKTIRLGEATLSVRPARIVPLRATTLQTPDLGPVIEKLVPERKYEVGDLIARGGMGLILEAQDGAIRRNVAMKVMLPRADHDDAMRFVQEAQITGQLEHPCIVPIYELGVNDERKPFYTMKYVRGTTLRHVLEGLLAGDPEMIAKYPLGTLLTVFQKMCDAVGFAHFRGVIHRDLKPGNVMIGDFGEVLVMDWGLAKVVGASEKGLPPPTRLGSDREFPGIHSVALHSLGSMTIAGAVLGTPQYMSPEQAHGAVETLDARSDIYALGAILYQILSLRPVVEGVTVAELLENVRGGKIVPITAAPNGNGKRKPSLPHLPAGRVPESLSAVCMKALATKPGDRYATVADLQKEIMAYQNGFATSAERASLFKHLQLAVLRHKTEATVLLVSLLLLVSLAAYVFQRVRTERDIAETERNTAKAERDRAEATLNRLRGTAPTFLENARALLEEGKFDDALSKVSFAISLQPENPDYALFRANLLESNQRISEAAAGYRTVLRLRPTDAVAQRNLALCDELLEKNKGAKTLSRDAQVELVDALIDQGRRVEAAPLALQLRNGEDAIGDALRARLKEYTKQTGWTSDRVHPVGDGTFSVNLNGFKLGDLKKLAGFPISKLDVGNTGTPDLNAIAQLPLSRLTLNYNRVPDLSPIHLLRLKFLDLRSADISDISPLAGMPLETLFLDATRVSDLSPLKGMPLKTCSLLNDTALRDISPLAGLPIEDINLQNTGVRDLTALRGMRLKILRLAFDREVNDFTPIVDITSLEELAVPFQALDVPLVGHFPNLHAVMVSGWMPDYISPTRFRAEVVPVAAPYLQLLTVVQSQIGRRPSGAAIRLVSHSRFDVDFSGLPIRTLAGFESLPIESLDLSRTQVQDIEPLRHIPLKWLRLDGTTVSDVAPLAEALTLEELVLPHAPKNVALLRKLPKLRYVSESWNQESDHPSQTAEAFWAEFDNRTAPPD